MIDRRRFLQNAAIAAAATVSAPLLAARRSDDSGSGATYEPDTLPANPEHAARYRSPPPPARTCWVRRPGEKATTLLVFPFVGTRDALATSRDGRRVPR